MLNVISWRESILQRGVVEEPLGERKTAAVHNGDLVAAIATILIMGEHSGLNYILTGPEILTLKMQVCEIALAINRQIEFIELNEEQTQKRWQEWGIPEATRNYLYEWYRNPPIEGYTVTSAIQEITGRPAQTFKQWIAQHKSLFMH